ncbi:hypothetical protein AB1Y20_001845 [Prymnesium parvum]|uniref:Exostosin GT47 domain-containing protein n=1 Tax=Prymnesium parvum TaxID=97485 RepID=A0AB34K8Y3_PRYPA
MRASQLPLLLLFASRASSQCVDTPDWHNPRGKSCADYAAFYCEGGDFKPGHSWVGGEAFGFPEDHCCACGKRAAPPPPAKRISYERHHNLACKAADHQVKKVSVETCERHCTERRCACFHFGKGLCRFGFAYLGLVKSTSGFAAYVRQEDGVSVPLQTLAPPPRAAAACAPPPRRAPPSFFLYSAAPFEWAARLAECYSRKNGRAPWASESANRSLAELGPAPPVDLAHSLWLHAALAAHPRRASSAAAAALFVVPSHAALSEAVGLCGGTTHAQRMDAAAAALAEAPAFQRAPSRHVVFAAGVHEGADPMGKLGELLARGGAVALCVDRSRCSSHFRKRAELPMMPLLSLLQPKAWAKLRAEACRAGEPRRRKTLMFFRGAHGTKEAAQAVRARVWQLRKEKGADIRFSKGGAGKLAQSTQTYLKSVGWAKDVRLSYNPAAYAAGMLRSDFCLLPRGEVASPGRRLSDALAAGCIPIFIGDALKPPLSRRLTHREGGGSGELVRYNNFSLHVSESEFLRYPQQTISEAIESALPRLGALRLRLLQAREELLLGFGDNPLNATFTRGADLVLLEAGRQICPRTPSTLRTCFPDLAA